MVRQSIAWAPSRAALLVANQLADYPLTVRLPAQPRDPHAASHPAVQDRSTAIPGWSKPVNATGIAVALDIELPGPTGNQGKTICYQGRFRTS